MKINSLQVGVQLAMIAILLVIGFFLNGKRINDYPISNHAWAQSDRYALAKGFENNNFNLFKPEALTYNHQFPDDWQTAQETTRTAVDFPIHDYVVAGLMQVFGTDDPWVFRSYILLYGIVGLFFLFRVSFRITQNVWRSSLVTFFAASSPVFVFYQAGFLPSIPSLANAIIAVYFYLGYLKNEKTTSWNWMIFFFVLAALSRTTFVIPLIAVLGVEFFRLLRGKTKLWNKLPSVIVGFAAIVGYMLYNAYLRTTFGSLFLYHLVPAKDFTQFVEIIKDLWENNIRLYFSIYHYIILGFVIIAAIWTKIKSKSEFSKENRNVAYFVLLYFLGVFLFIVAMIGQMSVHDYYFLDTLFFPILIGLSLLLAYIPAFDKSIFKISANVAALILIVLCFYNVNGVIVDRSEKYVLDEMKASISDFKGSEAWLDKNGVSKLDKILVIGAPTPNTPFILMNRKGFTTHRLSQKILKNSQKWDYDYVVYQNQYFYSLHLPIYPELLNNLELVTSNGKLTLCRRRIEPKELSIIDFMGLKLRKPILTEKLNLVGENNSSWTKMDSIEIDQGDRFVLMQADEEYGPTYTKVNWDKLTNGPSTFLTSLKVKMSDKKEAFVVIVVTDNNENTLYYAYPLHEHVDELSEWTTIEFYCPIPQVSNKENAFSVFLYNKGTKTLMVKDWQFRLTDFNQ